MPISCERLRYRGYLRCRGPRGNIVRRPAISHDAAWYRAYPRYRERDARYRGAGPDIAARTDDIARVCDIVRGARYRPPRAISQVRVASRTLSHDIMGRAWYRANPRYREREARYRAACDVIAAPCCDIVKPHDLAAVSRYRVVCARYREPVHDIAGSVTEIPLAVRS